MMIKPTKEHIEKLIGRFLDGTTSIEEEDVLRDYFLNEENLPEDWFPYREMFLEFEKMKTEGRFSVGKTDRRASFAHLRKLAVAAFVLLVCIAAVLLFNKNQEQPTIAKVEKTILKDSTQEKPVATPKLLAIETSEKPQPVIVKEKKPKPKSQPQRKAPADEPSVQAINKLENENAQLKARLESIQQEVEEIREQVFISEMRARGYQAVYLEDGSIQFIRKNRQPVNVEL